MKADKLTYKTQEAIRDAQRIASQYGNQQIDVEHLMLALIEDSEGLVPRILKECGADLNKIKADLKKAIEKIPKVMVPSHLNRFILLQDLISFLRKLNRKLSILKMNT